MARPVLPFIFFLVFHPARLCVIPCLHQRLQPPPPPPCSTNPPSRTMTPITDSNNTPTIDHLTTARPGFPCPTASKTASLGPASILPCPCLAYTHRVPSVITRTTHLPLFIIVNGSHPPLACMPSLIILTASSAPLRPSSPPSNNPPSPSSQPKPTDPATPAKTHCNL
ncbi:hypothetical protein NLG97_g7847 [Lecanicillium saksenae]|uniref:Uncharacterized protein n=1 Tax=Lecanicillium saksenae TaxID=468837 RepID=A0ACC1QM73_9HYPO|nr:hypothetical protein NLG97_g7847 [Lecanicillium saksenae]